MRAKAIILLSVAVLVIAAIIVTRLILREASSGQTAGLSAAAYHGGFGWTLVPAGERPDTKASLTRVSLKVDGRDHDLGVHEGSCAEVGEDLLLENELSGMLCWFAGGGDEIGVFREGDRLVVKSGQQDEGNAETGGFRGGFVELMVL